MKKLYLYNSISKKKELFTPIHPNKVGMYVCGPTVYDLPHLGNALAVVIYDVLYRLLQLMYGSKNVTYVRNITDVDDKIIIAAKEKCISIQELTQSITNIFQTNMQAINCLNPTFEPKATEHLDEMIEMIQKLLNQGFAYESNNHIYFRVNKFKNYNSLSGRKTSDLIAGARVEISENKENPEDFVLWKPENNQDEAFDSPFGKGRPGWHIECSAMSTKYLGNNFDIHGGGVDLIFPHHTNEIAQSCCANPGSQYAKYWVHNGFLTVSGEKMSKSLGNFITLDQLLKNNIEGEVIRYVLLASHYRKPIDWNEKALSDAKKSLDVFYRVLEAADFNQECEVSNEFLDALCDDLNTPKCFSLMHEYASEYNKTKDSKFANLMMACGNLLGFFMKSTKEWFHSIDIDENYINDLISKRQEAKNNKNWSLADQIREELKKLGIILEDNASGTNWKKL